MFRQLGFQCQVTIHWICEEIEKASTEVEDRVCKVSMSGVGGGGGR